MPHRTAIWPLLTMPMLFAAPALADNGEAYCDNRMNDITACLVSMCGEVPLETDPNAQTYAYCMEEAYEECDLRFFQVWSNDTAACGAHFDALANRPKADGETCAWEYITVSMTDMWVKVCASSAYPDSAKNTYGPYNLVDFDEQTAWAENVPGDGLGETIAFELEYPIAVTRFELENGYAKNGTVWENNGRVAEFYVVRPGHDGQSVEVADTPSRKVYDIPGYAKPVSWIGFQIVGAIHGRTDPDTVITGLLPY